MIKKIFASVVAGAIVAVFLMVGVNTTNSDTGRHIQNGRIVDEVLGGEREMADLSRLAGTNFYSYTEPSHPFVNHHLGSGYLLYKIYQAWDLAGAQMLYLLLSAASVSVLFFLSAKMGGLLPATAGYLLALRLLISREEVRPEGFSYVLIALCIALVCHLVGRKKITPLYLAVFFVIMALWVNLHIYFVFGLALIVLAACADLATLSPPASFKKWAPALLVSFAGTLLNPHFVQGALYPLFIFSSYEYPIVENKSIFFLIGIGRHQAIFYYIGATFLVYLVVVAAYLTHVIRSSRNSHTRSRCHVERERNIPRVVAWDPSLPFRMTWLRKEWTCLQALGSVELYLLLIGLWFGALSTLAIRNSRLWGMALLLVAPFFIERVIHRLVPDKTQRTYARISVCLLIGIVVSFLFMTEFMLRLNIVQLGEIERQDGAALYIEQNNLRGDMFNNYDIGSYLIFHNFPRHQVFVDNRPEAYSGAFIKKLIEMQEDDAVFQKENEKYHFTHIVFNYRDSTDWGQAFLARRMGDPAWIPVYADWTNIILLRDIPQNKALIKRDRMPPEMFMFADSM